MSGNSIQSIIQLMYRWYTTKTLRTLM